MNQHERCIELAAASIDFQLSPDEQHALRTHLAICDTCSVTVRGIRDDATRLAAAPHQEAPAAVRAGVIGATARRGAAGRRSSRSPGVRWAVLATMLAALLIAGSFVAGSVVDRFRGQDLPAPTLPTAIQQATPAPAATDLQAPKPTASPGWNDLGDVSEAFDGRSVTSVMRRPDGGLVAFGQDRVSAIPVVWVSDDGVDWVESAQSKHVFSDAIPTTGALGGPGMLVVGKAVSVLAEQRAIWESTDGRTWTESPDASAKLHTNADDLTIVSGPAGVIVWRPSGAVWVSTDGETWTPGDIGRQGVSDVSVDSDGFAAVGQVGSDAFLVTSADGQSWGTPRQQPAAAGTQVGIERADDGTEVVWIGDRRWQRTGSGWRAVEGSSVPTVPAPAFVVGGQEDLAAIGSPSGGDTYRAWTWDGAGDWVSDRHPAEAGSGAPTVVGVAPHGSGWYVLTRRGGAFHGWLLQP